MTDQSSMKQKKKVLYKALILCTLLLSLVGAQEKLSLWLIPSSRQILPEYKTFGNQFLATRFKDLGLFKIISDDSVSLILDSAKAHRYPHPYQKVGLIKTRFQPNYKLTWAIKSSHTSQSKVSWYPLAGDKKMVQTLEARLINRKDSTLFNQIWKSDTTQRDWFCGVWKCKIPSWTSSKKSQFKKELLINNLNQVINKIQSLELNK